MRLANWSAAQAAVLLGNLRHQGRGKKRSDNCYGITLRLGAVVGKGVARPCVSSGNFKLLKSEPLIVNMPSRPSTRAKNVPSLFCAPTVSFCDVLLSGEVVKLSTSFGLSSPC